MTLDTAEFKQQAGEYAVNFVESGMVVGLGHGSTAIFAVHRLGELLREGRLQGVLAVPCSPRVEATAQRLGIPLASLDERPIIDLTIDGADEVDPELNLIKGGGGALLREKVVAQVSCREIIVVDDSKLSPALGTRAPVPVEVVPFGWRSQAAFLAMLGAHISLRRNADGSFFYTEQGNLLLDADFGVLKQPQQLALQLSTRAGIVEHGLFIFPEIEVIAAGEQGLRHFKRGELAAVEEQQPHGRD